MADLFPHAGTWVLAVIERLGYPGLAALIVLENVFPPIPSELILPLAGYLAAQGRLSLVGVVVSATAGSLVGALALYVLGAVLGEDRLRGLVRRAGRYAGVREAELDGAIRWFRRYGAWAVLLCRLLPIMRSLISLPAGLVGLRLQRFLLLTALGTAAWNGLLAGLGYSAGAQWPRIVALFDAYERLALTALVVALAVWLWRRRSGRPSIR